MMNLYNDANNTTVIHNITTAIVLTTAAHKS